jgi:exodeoxyribonuclease-5
MECNVVSDIETFVEVQAESSLEPALELSRQQLAARNTIETWYLDSTDQVFRLDGPAGSGKTTLMKEVALHLRVSVVFGAYTGKAAHVLRSKGCLGASTIDQMIYVPKIAYSCDRAPPCDDDGCSNRSCPYRRERFVGRTLDIGSAVRCAGLVIVDEVSMVNEEMGRDLLSFDTKVLVVGDKFQLPPVAGAGFLTNGPIDFDLTEVHRQAWGSPVIQLANTVRQGGTLEPGAYGDSAVIGANGIPLDLALEADQIICGKNETRCTLNQHVRRARGFTGDFPQPGERVISLKNRHRKGIYNGSIWSVIKVASGEPGFVQMEIADDDGRIVAVDAPISAFSAREGGNELPGDPFTYAYCITAHKAQGSEWNNVLVIDESRIFRESAARWLYTALTRAAKRVTVVRRG